MLEEVKISSKKEILDEARKLYGKYRTKVFWSYKLLDEITEDDEVIFVLRGVEERGTTIDSAYARLLRGRYKNTM